MGKIRSLASRTASFGLKWAKRAAIGAVAATAVSFVLIAADAVLSPDVPTGDG